MKPPMAMTGSSLASLDCRMPPTPPPPVGRAVCPAAGRDRRDAAAARASSATDAAGDDHVTAVAVDTRQTAGRTQRASAGSRNGPHANAPPDRTEPSTSDRRSGRRRPPRPGLDGGQRHGVNVMGASLDAGTPSPLGATWENAGRMADEFHRTPRLAA